MNTKIKDFLNQRIKEDSEKEDPIVQKEETGTEHARREMDQSIMVKPQPKSNGRIGGIEI